MARGVLLMSAMLLLISGARSIQNEEVWEAILYGFIVDPNSPTFLTRGDVIFEVPDVDRMVAISSNPTMNMEVVYSSSEHTAAEDFALSVGIEGSYGAFSAAASMEVSRSSESSVKTVRLDSIIKALKYEVASKNEFRTFPEKYLTENFKKSVKTLPVEKIEQLIGSFYARRLDLGGEVKKSYVMQATSRDTQQSVSAELSASYGGSMLGGSVSTSTSYSNRKSNQDAEMSIKWFIKGGDTTVWLGKDISGDDTEVSAIQDEWSHTITDDFLHTFDFELGYMWDLIKAVDKQKGEEFQRYLEKKWEAQSKEFQPTKFIDSGKQCPSSHPNPYYNGEWCCKTDREKNYYKHGYLCDGSAIQYDSLCCANDAHIRCPAGICAPVKIGCPSSHPNPYYNGEWCCASNREKHYSVQGSKCDGSVIAFDSLCCANDLHIRCPTGLCFN